MLHMADIHNSKNKIHLEGEPVLIYDNRKYV